MNNEFNEEVKGQKTEALIRVIAEFFQRKFKDILVVGCGSGREAGMLARAFDANVIGIDVGIDFSFDHEGSAPAQLLSMDARALTFASDSFDMAFLSTPLNTFPSRSELSARWRGSCGAAAFISSAHHISRVCWEVSTHRLVSWCALESWEGFKPSSYGLSGRWSNEAGAHTGFTVAELSNDCVSCLWQRNGHIASLVPRPV